MYSLFSAPCRIVYLHDGDGRDGISIICSPQEVSSVYKSLKNIHPRERERMIHNNQCHMRP